MTSRPDVMQLLFFFPSSEKHRLARKKGGGVQGKRDTFCYVVCLHVCISFPFRPFQVLSQTHWSAFGTQGKKNKLICGQFDGTVSHWPRMVVYFMQIAESNYWKQSVKKFCLEIQDHKCYKQYDAVQFTVWHYRVTERGKTVLSSSL